MVWLPGQERWFGKLLYFLYVIFFLACVVLIGTVLLQPGKTDAGALFTSNISSSAFGPRGTASILSKITIVAASLFMVLAFLISMPSLQGGVSVLETVGDAPVQSAPSSQETTDNPAANVANTSDAAPPSEADQAPANAETGTAPANK